MSNRRYRTAPAATSEMPGGVPYIVANEAAERFSFYGMRTILVIFMTKYLHLMNAVPGEPVSEAIANDRFHLFVSAVYFTPILGALLADIFAGKYRTIIWLSIVYCLGHGTLAMMGMFGTAEGLMLAGLGLIALGSGGIKPCVSAHVGDQFGESNQSLLTKVFNWFYWSINLGAFVSTLATPWLLHWYGPHWAFGVPGILMLLATILFWMGRWKFIHIPAKGPKRFFGEILSREGLAAIGKLFIIYLFVAVFWALFDQTGSSWVFQADSMDRRFLGVEWLPSQIQVLNPILILLFIPLFTYVIYPALNRMFELTPIRKIAIGLFLMAVGFSIVALAQEWIDQGQRPSIGWQLLAFILLTASEVMVSIVCLEFSYTQAPRAMKSMIMALFLVSVSMGNLFTAGVNHYIQIPNQLAEFAATRENESVMTHSGLDRQPGTADDIQIAFNREGKRTATVIPASEVLQEANAKISASILDNSYSIPSQKAGMSLIAGLVDPWGSPLRYIVVNSRQCRVYSIGPDKIPSTEWDSGLVIKVDVPSEETSTFLAGLRPELPWLTRRKQELNIPTLAVGAEPEIGVDPFVGGQTRLQGAAYFWFFTKVMISTAILFLLVVIFYKPKTYFHEEEPVGSTPAKP